ncbi:MAG: endonuclease MutS2 [Longimicrobiales bacterium]
MNQHALQVLEFHEALDIVARYASSSLGAAAVRALEPSDAMAWIEPELRRVDQMAAFLLRNDDWVIALLPDLRQPLRRLAIEGSVWEGAWFRDAADLLASARQARSGIARQGSDYPLLLEIAERMAELPGIEQTLRGAIDSAGAVRDDASKELARTRRELRAARTRIVQRLEAYVASLPDNVRVADASISVRDGRYVVPIRREGRAEVGGIVHDESATGATLFVEPPLAIELMNRLRELELAEAREVQRILRELTVRLRPHSEALHAMFDALIGLDALFARGRYILLRNARRPAVVPAGAGEYRVREGRHPLLAESGDTVVPFDLVLEAGERTLLVSGPNTGGKTVLLKAIGLLSLLAQAGVIPPVGAGTTLPLFHDVFADIGDEQSIEASLSTFSAHLKNLREILEHADAGSLVLIDEIGSGTDPAEGGALAQAILLELTRRHALTIATSHLGQLKRLAGEEAGVVNASLQFDSRELRPTYRLIKGVPGRSYGLAIARRLGFPEALLEQAQAHLPGGETEVSELLAELEDKDRRMAETLARAEAARYEAERASEDLERRERELQQREREAERRARQQARDLLTSARSEVESTIRELREAAAHGAVGSIDRAAHEVRQRLEQAAQRQAERAPRERRAQPERPLVEGGWVRLASTGATGRVAEVRDGRALVELGALRLHLPVEELEPTAAPRRDTSAGGGGWTAPAVEAAPELDLRGLRADEVASRLEPAVDAASRADLPSLRIIHGKGTGALREVVAKLLRSDPRVAGLRAGGPGEGGTGVTVAELA